MFGSQMDQVVDLLKETGWTKPQAECYCTLVRFGPAKASKIASEIGMRKAKVYEPLNTLEEKGFVNIQDENPKKYMAQNPRYVIGVENERMKKRSEEILKNLEEAWEVQEDISGEENTAKILRGTHGRDTELQNIIDKMQKTLIGVDLRLARSSRNTLNKMKDEAKDVEIRLIGGTKSSGFLKALHDEGVQVRTLTGTVKTSYYVADDQHVLLNTHNGETTVALEDREIAKIFTNKFEDLFKKGKSLKENVQ